MRDLILGSFYTLAGVLIAFALRPLLPEAAPVSPITISVPEAQSPCTYLSFERDEQRHIFNIVLNKVCLKHTWPTATIEVIE